MERLILPERLVASGLWVIKLANSVWLIRMIVNSCRLFSQSKQWRSVCEELAFSCQVCDELVFSCQVVFCLCTGFVAVSSTASSTEHPHCKNTQPKMWSAGFESPLAGKTLLAFKFSTKIIYYTLFWEVYTVIMSLPTDWQMLMYLHTRLAAVFPLSFPIIPSREGGDGEVIEAGRVILLTAEVVVRTFSGSHKRPLCHSVLPDIMLTASKTKETEGKKDLSHWPSYIGIIFLSVKSCDFAI